VDARAPQRLDKLAEGVNLLPQCLVVLAQHVVVAVLIVHLVELLAKLQQLEIAVGHFVVEALQVSQAALVEFVGGVVGGWWLVKAVLELLHLRPQERIRFELLALLDDELLDAAVVLLDDGLELTPIVYGSLFFGGGQAALHASQLSFKLGVAPLQRLQLHALRSRRTEQVDIDILLLLMYVENARYIVLPIGRLRFSLVFSGSA